MAFFSANIRRHAREAGSNSQEKELLQREEFDESQPSMGCESPEIGAECFLKGMSKHSFSGTEVLVDGEAGMEVPLGKPEWIIPAASLWKSRWDWWIISIVIYNSIMIPWSFAFLVERRPLQEAADYIGDFFFLMDILLTFRTAYINKHGQEITSRKEIRKRYLRLWFWADLVAVFPFELFAIAAKVNLSLSVLNLFKLPRLLRLSRLSKKIDRFVAAKKLRIMYLLAAFALFAHWVACSWVFLGRFQSQGNEWSGSVWLVNSGLCQTMKGAGNWIDGKFVPTLPEEVGTLHKVNGVVSCIQERHPEHRAWRLDSTSPVTVTRTDNETIRILPEAGAWTQYVASYYWSLSTLTTVGHGDIPPSTNAERIFTVFVMLFGAIMYATIIGNVVVLIHCFDATNARFNERASAIRNFAKFYDINKNILKKMLVYHARANYQTHGINAREMTKELPPNFRGEVLVNMHKSFVGKLSEISPWLSRNEFFFAEMLAKLDGQICLEDDYLAIDGMFSQAMFFVSSGTLEINCRSLAEKEAGSEDLQEFSLHLRAGEYVGRECLQASGVEISHLRAATSCELYQMSHLSMKQLERQFEEDIHGVKAYSLARINAKVRKVKCRRESSGNVSLSEVETVLKDAKERVLATPQGGPWRDPREGSSSSSQSSIVVLSLQEQVNRLEASVKSIHAGLEEKMDHMVHDVLKAIGDAHGPPSGSFRYRAVPQ